MKNMMKIIVSLVLLLMFVITCFFAFGLFSIGAWLHTYNTFTRKDLVAVVEVGPSQFDDQGLEYTEVKYKQLDKKSALENIFSSREKDNTSYSIEQDYKIYGDQVEVGGQFVKFRDFWLLFNLRNIYKVTKISGEYSDPEVEKSLPNDKKTTYALNGGVDSYWKTLEKDSDHYDFLVDSVYGNFSTKFLQDKGRVYGLYATEDGFILDKLEQ